MGVQGRSPQNPMRGCENNASIIRTNAQKKLYNISRGGGEGASAPSCPYLRVPMIRDYNDEYDDDLNTASRIAVDSSRL